MNSEDGEASSTISLKEQRKKERKMWKNRDYYSRNKERLLCKRKKKKLVQEMATLTDLEEKKKLETQWEELDVLEKSFAAPLKGGRKPLLPEDISRSYHQNKHPLLCLRKRKIILEILSTVSDPEEKKRLQTQLEELAV